MTLCHSRLLHETDWGPNTHNCIVCQRLLYLNKTRLPKVELVYQVASVKENTEWRRPVGRLQIPWRQKVGISDSIVLGMTRESAWTLARMNPGGRWAVQRKPRGMLPLID